MCWCPFLVWRIKLQFNSKTAHPFCFSISFLLYNKINFIIYTHLGKIFPDWHLHNVLKYANMHINGKVWRLVYVVHVFRTEITGTHICFWLLTVFKVCNIFYLATAVLPKTSRHNINFFLTVTNQEIIMNIYDTLNRWPFSLHDASQYYFANLMYKYHIFICLCV